MDIQSFLNRCAAYCAARRMSESRLSTILFGSGITIGRLRAGKGVTVRVLERAEGRLQDREAEIGNKAAA